MNRVHNAIVISTLLGCFFLAIICLAMGTTSAVGSATLPGGSPSGAGILSEGETNLNQALIEGICHVSENFPPEIRQWCSLITFYAEQHGLSPNLIAALIWQESGGNALAYSKSGAVGLMQVMPRDGLAANFQCVNGPCFADRPTIAELQDPTFNIAYGTSFLAGLINHWGNLRDALKAYGPANVGYYYADIVLGIYQRYGEE
jgi:soluble lytic murein transglycosylase-like protein